MWGKDHHTRERFRQPQRDESVDVSCRTTSIQRYSTERPDPATTWPKWSQSDTGSFV